MELEANMYVYLMLFVFAVVSALVLWLKSKYPSAWVFCGVAVSVAELLCRFYHKEQNGVCKKRAVMAFLQLVRDKLGLKLDDATLNDMVELTVKELNKLLDLLKLE